MADKYPDWVLAPVNANDYRMNMKPSALVDLKRNTVAQERDTIERRVNALGLTEPTVQDYGASEKQSEILVELPGVDDPARVKDLIGTTAQLKIVSSAGRSVADERSRRSPRRAAFCPSAPNC